MTHRTGTTLLLVGGATLIAWMLYALTLGGPRRRHEVTVGPPQPTTALAEVAVFLPDPSDWEEFVSAAGDVASGPKPTPGAVAFTVRTPVHGHAVRFVWESTPGVAKVRQEVERLLQRGPPLVAVVGSDKTVLTRAIAETLAGSSARDPNDTPVLLVPWATAVDARPDARMPDSARKAFLNLHPGRTFRFCANNDVEARLVVEAAVRTHPDDRPERVLIVSDPNDPYSADLTGSFRRALGNMPALADLSKGDIVVETPPAPPPGAGMAVPGAGPTTSEPPSPAERRWAEEVWKQARKRPTWLVLPLLETPTVRLLSALKAVGSTRPRSESDRPLIVLCGDGLGVRPMSELAGSSNLDVRSVSTAPAPRTDGKEAIPEGAAVYAEIVEALLTCLDTPEPPTADVLKDRLAKLNIERTHAGRSLAFDRGERRGGDLGYVLRIRPDRSDVSAQARDASGQWSEPVTVQPPPEPDRWSAVTQPIR